MKAMHALGPHGATQAPGTLTVPGWPGDDVHFQRTPQRIRTRSRWWSKLAELIRLSWRRRELARNVAHLSPHLLRDIGLDPINLERSISLHIAALGRERRLDA